MKTLTNLTLTNLKQNRARTIMTIIGVALSVALILACIGFGTSLTYSERQDSVIRFGDYHIMYMTVPGDKLYVIEEAKVYQVQFYSEPVGCVMTEYGYPDCEGRLPYPVGEYTPIYDSSQLIRDSSHKYNVFLKYTNPARADENDNWLAGRLRDADAEYGGFIKNDMVAYLDGDVPETTAILSFWLSFVFIGAMSIIAAFVIRNSFTISITERVRQFGMLASIGARPKQIRYMVYQEGLFIGLIAIPLGILLGVAATGIVVAAVNSLVGFSDATDMLLYIPLETFGVIILTGMFIVFLSAASPAIVASRVSPIAALRNVQDTKVKARKLKTSKLTQKLFGIGGVIAAKNLKRSRSKYRTTVISIVLSVAVFIGISSFMMYGHKTVELFNEDTGANVILSASHSEIYDDIIQKFNVKEYAIYNSIALDMPSTDEPVIYPVVRIVSRGEFERYARKVGVSSNFSDAVILQDAIKSIDSHGNYVLKRLSEYKVGDEFKFYAAKWSYDESLVVKCDPDYLFNDIPEEEYGENELAEIEKCKNGELDGEGGYNQKRSDLQTIKISTITDVLPTGESSITGSASGTIYISEDHPVAKKLKSYYILDLGYITDSGLGEEIMKYVEDSATIEKYKKQLGDDSVSVYAIDIEAAMKTTRNTILLFEIILYGFIAVAAIIGITNIFNTITTNVALRAKEFAVLKSIGMTEKEFNRMIRLESLMYTTRALLIGLPIGFLMSYGVSKLFNEAMLGFGWLIPWGSVIICIVVVAALVALIMYYSVRKIKKQNIIETIRKESF